MPFFEEFLIYLFIAVLVFPALMVIFEAEFTHPAWLIKMGIGSERSEPATLSSQFTVPIFPTYRGKSILETRMTDKTKAETAIKAIYKQAGLKTPHIIWTQSPLANVFAKAAIDYFSEDQILMPWRIRYRAHCDHNDDIRAQAWQSVRKAGCNVGDRGTGDEAWCDNKLYEDRDDICWGHIPTAIKYELPNGLDRMSRNNAWFDIAEIVNDRSQGDWLVDLWARFRFASLYPKPREYKGGSRSMHIQLSDFKDILRHQKNLNCLPAQVPDTDHHHFSYPTDMRSDFQALRDAAGWVMPYTHICFVSQRPNHLELDENERLHCETGPAMVYSDGFMVHAWHGTVFPEEWAKTKPTAHDALYWRNIEQRRVACEILGWEAILGELDCVSLDKDEDPEIGELVSVKMPGTAEDKFLRVTCGTGRKFSLPVPSELITARQANAWTWGLSPDQYNPEVRT